MRSISASLKRIFLSAGLPLTCSAAAAAAALLLLLVAALCRYKTKMCRDGAHCNRIFCFFAHSQEELRTPFSAAAKPPGNTASAAAAAGHGLAGSSNSSSCSTATNTPMNQPATPSVSSSPAAAGMYGSAQQQQQQMMGAACRASLDQQQQQQVLLPPAVGLAGNSTAMQVPLTACRSSGISGGNCILLAPAGSDSYTQQQLQLQQPGAAVGNMFSACQPVNAGMLLNGGYADSLPQQQQVFAAAWQQGWGAASFISADSSMVGSMGQPLLQINTQQQQLQLVSPMQYNAAVGSPVSGLADVSQAQLINWPSSATAAAGGGGGVTSSPLGVSSAVGTFDVQYMQQQQPAAAVAGGMMLQPGLQRMQQQQQGSSCSWSCSLAMQERQLCLVSSVQCWCQSPS
jgi:hypothetical protein